jgi:uncharacterized RDD family membrane protein YckC
MSGLGIDPAPDPDFDPGTTSAFTFGGYAGREGALTGATFLPRAIARIIDLVLHLVISLFSGFILGIMLVIAGGGHIDPLMAHKLRNTGISNFVFALLGSIALNVFQDAIHGSSLGKLMLGMTVVQEDGSPCRFGSAIVRNFAYLIDSLFFGLVGYFHMQKTPQEQRYGDEWAHTIVCKNADLPAGTSRGAGRFIAGFLLGCMADSALTMTGVVLQILF